METIPKFSVKNLKKRSFEEWNKCFYQYYWFTRWLNQQSNQNSCINILMCNDLWWFMQFCSRRSINWMKEKLAHFVRLHCHQSLFAAFEILLRNPILKIREGKSTEKILSLSAIAKTKVSTQLTLTCANSSK